MTFYLFYNLVVLSGIWKIETRLWWNVFKCGTEGFLGRLLILAYDYHELENAGRVLSAVK